MSLARKRNYFIVKHDLDSLHRLPNYVWRTNKGPRSRPHRYNEVRPGDRWIAFAYYNDAAEQPLSLVTGFFECVKPAVYGRVPKQVDVCMDYRWAKRGYAWMIVGKEWRRQPREPVLVRPVNEILHPKRVFNNQSIVPIAAEDFEKIRDHVAEQEFKTSKIPLIQRDPQCEQELLAIVIAGHKELGIDRVLRVRKSFPDLLVKIGGKEMHLELEVYSQGFFLHHHDKYVKRGRFCEDGKPVAVLCWIDDCAAVKEKVRRVYSVRSLLRNGGTLATS